MFKKICDWIVDNPKKYMLIVVCYTPLIAYCLTYILGTIMKWFVG